MADSRFKVLENTANEVNECWSFIFPSGFEAPDEVNDYTQRYQSVFFIVSGEYQHSNIQEFWHKRSNNFTVWNVSKLIVATLPFNLKILRHLVRSALNQSTA
ncbi:hypothetical protein PanWU01x14_307000 [Parasponia andersonii]|uniref:Uncharacterized protein n=1 Tax=Parasponia andersonii TaxID=3476 RepID=A0A2P5ARL9_PARAD|nr:hypothetical protein PanWU01x14_307000 [Parasponia andersonii]